MHIASTTFAIRTPGRGMIEITPEVRRWAESQGIEQGLLSLFIRHTSASLLIQENAAPQVRGDLERFFERLAPEDSVLYAHDDEGPDDMPAHIRAALTQTSLSIPVITGALALGTWQGVYVFEHRARAHGREVSAVVMGV